MFNKVVQKEIKRFFLKQNIIIEADGNDTGCSVVAYRRKKKLSVLLASKIKQNELYIVDFKDFSNGRFINKGIGSIMMPLLIEYAETHNYKSIVGKLIKLDRDDHKDRLHHFYNKFGFKIEEFEEDSDCFYAKIVKNL